jgi:8-oxo-dGTP diphosphatase
MDIILSKKSYIVQLFFSQEHIENRYNLLHNQTMKNNENNIVKVGVGCWIFNKSGQVLLGKRLSKHGTNQWAPPGGHLEFGETPQQCASRETYEETHMKISPKNFDIISVTNDIFRETNKHYVTIHVVVKNVSKKPVVVEHDKCEQWKWFDMDKLPKPLFLSAKNLLKQKQL